MGLITAGIATAMTTGSAALPLPIPPQEPWAEANRLFSELLSAERLRIHLTAQDFDISPQLDAAIHTSILSGFEHRYFI